jgi:hypothetical protein
MAALVLRRRPAQLAAAAVALLAAQRFLEMRGTYPTLPARSLAPHLTILAGLPRTPEPYRVVAGGEVLRPNGAALYSLEDVRGYESLVLRRFEETYPLWCRRQFASHNRVDDLGPPFLSFLDVRYAIASPDVPAPTGWLALSRGPEAAVFENPRALSRAFVPRKIRVEPDAGRRLAEMGEAKDFGEFVWLSQPPHPVPAGREGEENGAAAVTVWEVGPDLRIDVDARERVLIATSVPDWSGWRAEASGRSLELATVNHAFLGFWVPPGRHAVQLRYLPQTFVFGSVLAGVSLGAALLVSLLRRRRVIP